MFKVLWTIAMLSSGAFLIWSDVYMIYPIANGVGLVMAWAMITEGD